MAFQSRALAREARPAKVQNSQVQADPELLAESPNRNQLPTRLNRRTTPHRRNRRRLPRAASRSGNRILSAPARAKARLRRVAATEPRAAATGYCRGL